MVARRRAEDLRLVGAGVASFAQGPASHRRCLNSKNTKLTMLLIALMMLSLAGCVRSRISFVSHVEIRDRLVIFV